MSDSVNFGGTITGGIQDISALLPLLGTEQCEKHVGSALDRGFLYSSVTPISIFGSLGIVRAAFNILIASLNIQRYRFLGATKLSDGGFTPNGIVAPMIALDPKHPKRFLVETRLEAMLTEEHIENVEDLTVSWGKGILWWNFLLIAFTLVIASTGLVPYIRIINPDHVSLKALFPLGFGFPILRVVGSGLCVNVAQFLIQIRVLVLLKTRLLFITIDRLAMEAGIDLESEINTNMGRKRSKSAWNSELASEKCIWALRRCLAKSDTESLEDHLTVKDIYASQYKRQMESIDTRIPHWMGPLLVFGLVLGCLSTVVGYIGCFYLIQHSERSNGPLLWLVLETLLSVSRILVWAINPSWDDSKGIVFELQLASHAPLITCSKFEGDIAHDGVAPLMRSNRFLEEVVAYTGPFPAFVVPDVALYYILTAKGGSETKNDETPPPGILYVVLSDHKEQTSRILFKEGHRKAFAIYISSLEPVPGSTAINVKVDFSKEGRKTEPRTHFLTSDPVFMTQLEEHYDEINSKIQKQRSNMERKAFFGKTWAMQKPTEDDDGDDDNLADGGDDKGQSVVKDHRMSGSLTAEDMAYLRQGQVERRFHDMFRQLEEWIGLFMTLYTKELLQDVPTDLVFKKDESVTIVQKYEANEVEFLLIECRRIFELLLLSTAGKWDQYVKRDHANMVTAVLDGTFKPIDPHQDASTARKQHSEEIRKNKMMMRLADELESLLEKETQTRRENLRNRLTAQTESTDQRVQGRQYTDPVGEAIMNAWKALPTDITSEAAETFESPGTSDEETDSVAKSASRSGSVVSLSATHSRSASIKEDAKAPSSSGSRRGSEEIDEKKGSVKSDSARVVKTVASRRAEFMAGLDDRHRAAEKELENYKDSIEKTKQLIEVKEMHARCRKRANQLFSRLEAQTAEFEDLHTNDVLTADTHELVDYWSNTSLQERRRLQDRTQQYLRLTNASIESVGGRQNMLRALKRSQEFSFIDIHESNLLTGEELKSVVESVKSVAGVTSPEGGQEIYKAVMANVRAAVGMHRDMFLYRRLFVTDQYRSGRPYLLFGIRGASFCVVYFYIQTRCDHTVTLRHCVTTNSGKVNLKLNGHELTGSWGQTQAVQHNFANEDIHLPNDHLRDVGEHNMLEIILDNESVGPYWLSDVFLPVQPVQVATISDTTAT
ncbi:hypothetical protein D9619_000537 [Psilocybe cf. subviscida]|uniref:Uncharacterized protein n=1 Tax=Psilocybe cf. subviscida TaxID=2480587 RepID=A0A8H5BD42_9AGAR|nr:hypothetical protein D9619_000537 [Psilocybe cf. subviscida]